MSNGVTYTDVDLNATGATAGNTLSFVWDVGQNW